MKPILSVWMPNYNHAQYIGRAIDAIAKQSWKPDKFTIINDASTDESKIVIEKYQKQYPWITVIYNKKNVGVLSIMEQGVRESNADYIVMTSADDYILPDFFAQAMDAAMQHPKAGIIFGQMRVEDESGNYIYTGKASTVLRSCFLSPDEYMKNYLLKEAVTQSMSAASIYRVNALREVGGFRSELGPWCDTFALQAIALTHGAYYIAQPVSVWVVHAASVSQGVRSRPSAMFQVIRKASALMRNRQFRALFPKSYIRRWAFRYRIVVCIQYCIAISPRWLQKWYYFAIHKLA